MSKGEDWLWGLIALDWLFNSDGESSGKDDGCGCCGCLVILAFIILFFAILL